MQFNAQNGEDLGTKLITFLKKPVVIILIVGLVARFILMPLLTVNCDSDFWALIVKNFEAGEGLYGLEGYYYSPVWGYVLGAMSGFQDMFLNIDVLGTRVTDALYLESSGEGWPFSATLTTVAFNTWIKFAFVISDLIIGYIIYWLIKNKTNDEKKAAMGFGIWFLCPLVIRVTTASMMFDTISVMFILLTIVLIYTDRCFLGGMTFSFAVLTKFFPAFLIFVLVAYVLAKHRGDGQAVKKLIQAALGATVALVILLIPQILDGNVADCFTFISDRASSEGDVNILSLIVSKTATLFYVIIAIASALIARQLYISKSKDLDNTFFFACLTVITLLFLYPPNPQYLVLLIPLLAYSMIVHDRRFRIGFVLISIASIISLIVFSPQFLVSFAAYTDFLSLDGVLNALEALKTSNGFMILTGITSVIQYIGIFSVICVIYLRYKEKKAGILQNMSDEDPTIDYTFLLKDHK